MPQPESVQRARRDLGNKLRTLRTNKDFTGKTLAAICGWHPSKVSRIENGQISASADDIRAWTAACGQPGEAPEMIVALETIATMHVEWRELEKNGLAKAQEVVIPLWEETKRYKAYALSYIPGPFQTEDYTRAVLSGIRTRRGLSDEDFETAVAIRAAKQKYLRSGQFRILLEEDVLYTRYAERSVMLNQLTRLIQVADYSSVSLGIIPRDAARGAAHKAHDFWIFDDKTVQVEIVSAFLTLKQQHEVKRYLDDFQHLSELAATYGSAVPLLAKAITAYG
ncbi:helix-turn-helix domain-containing protein [Streptomyces sp. SID4985]|uniref:helix-turn-helix domain-containing protein n=1 Tax=Streptomyces sp. SID4985 TaxID=2690292 RepID=UPI00136A9378|nr:helix-turn-helix transcriptional regulator [Streptomyces sp. SID4985]MYQ48765.1 helix-turn-helix domain-containing protein [Streptomyces sp. SID4985]